MTLARTPLKRRVGLKTRKRLERRTPLKASKGLAPVSEKQRAKNILWNKITDERAAEEYFICQWCHKQGQRLYPDRFWDWLDGHHIVKRRHNNHTRENCYIAHRLCHNFIEDNNIDVSLYRNKQEWDARQRP